MKPLAQLKALILLSFTVEVICNMQMSRSSIVCTNELLKYAALQYASEILLILCTSQKYFCDSYNVKVIYPLFSPFFKMVVMVSKMISYWLKTTDFA